MSDWLLLAVAAWITAGFVTFLFAASEFVDDPVAIGFWWPIYFLKWAFKSFWRAASTGWKP